MQEEKDKIGAACRSEYEIAGEKKRLKEKVFLWSVYVYIYGKKKSSRVHFESLI